MVTPQFSDDDMDSSDWNDLHNRYGIEKVGEQIGYQFQAEIEKKRQRESSECLQGGIDSGDRPYSDFPMPPVIQDTLRWIDATAMLRQPELSLLNTLTVLGAVFGRRYTLERFNTRTNLYTVGIAETGQGKDTSRKRLKELMLAAKLGGFLGSDELRTGAGLLMHMATNPSLVFMIDEIGMLLNQLKSADTPSYQQSIMAIITKLYSSSSSSYTEGKLKGDGVGAPTVIKEPNLCIYGTTNSDTYSEALKQNVIESGELNRFIILPTREKFPTPSLEAQYMPPPEDLVQRWNAFAPRQGVDSVTVVSLGMCLPRVQGLLLEQCEKVKQGYEDGRTGALWVRMFENTLKVAMILAIARDYENPILCDDDIDFAYRLVVDSIKYIGWFSQNKMFVNDFDRQCNVVTNFLEGTDDKTSTRREIMRKFKIDAKTMAAIESSLSVDGGSGRLLISIGDKGSKVYTLV